MGIKDFIAKKLKISSLTPDDLRKAGASVGTNVKIYTKKIDVSFAPLLVIGNNVTLSDCRLLMHDASTYPALNYSRVGRIVIGDNVFIGADAIVLPNVKIGSNVIVGAGSIVTKDIPDNSVVAGCPAKVIKEYDRFIIENSEQMKTASVFNTYHSLKSDEEWKKERESLIGGYWIR